MEGVIQRNEKRQQLSRLNDNIWIKGGLAKEGESGGSPCIQILLSF